MQTTKAFKKTMAVLMISVAGFTATGCDSIPKPFEQEVPQTTWVVDENGKKTKVVTGENEGIATPQQVTNAANEFYASIFNDKGFTMFMKKEFQALSDKASKIDPNDPKQLAKYKDEISATVIKANPKFLTLINFDESSKAEKNEVVYEIFTAYAMTFLFISLAGNDSKIEVDIPITAIRVIKGEMAEVDLRKGKMKVTLDKKETTKDMNEGKDEKPILKMVKSDGKWMVVGNSLLAPSKK